MSDPAFRKTFGQPQGGFVAPAVFFISPLIAAVVPRLSWLALCLIAITLIALYLKRGGAWRELVRPNAVLSALVAVAAFALLSAVWAADAGGAIEKSGLLLVIVIVAFAAARAIEALDQRELRGACTGFVLGTLLGAIFVVIEICSGGVVTTSVGRLIAAIFPDLASKIGPDTSPFRSSVLRQNVAVLTFLLWPALLIAAAPAVGLRRVFLIGVLILAVGAAVFISPRLSAQLAFVASLAAFPIAWAWSQATVRALAALWCAAFILVLPIDLLAYRAGLHTAEWVPGSARARVILWQYTAERTLENPWLGVGADSTSTLNEARGFVEKPEGFAYARKTGPHAHKLFLQIWYELGVGGVLLLMLAGALTALAILRLAPFTQPFAVATFTTFCVTVAFAWSMWQTWLVCAVASMAIYLLVAARRATVACTAGQAAPGSFASSDSRLRDARAAIGP